MTDRAAAGVRGRWAGFDPTGLLMTLCFVFAQADKQVMGLLALPVRAQFHLSNTQLGLLQGATFAIAYSIGGVPIARLIDGGHRVRIAAACILAWSIATLASGLAQSFALLVIWRAVTAVAEAGLPPAAFSIFRQSGDRRRMTRMNGLFMLAPFVGGGLVLALGGALLSIAERDGLAFAGWNAPWRLVLLAIGGLGLLLAPLLWWLGREPARPGHGEGRPPLPTIGSIVADIVASRFLRAYYLALTACLTVNYAVGAWYPALLAQRFGLGVGTAGRTAGMIFLAGGVLGTLAAAAIAPRRWRGSLPRMLRDYLGIAILLVPVSIGLALANSLAISLVCYGLFGFLAAAIASTMMTPIQLSLDDGAFARGFAIFTLLSSAGAGSLGPLLTGSLIDRFALSLPQALALCGGAATLLTVAMFAAAWRAASAAEA